jgi:hypothetical protein
MGICNCKDAKK